MHESTFATCKRRAVVVYLALLAALALSGCSDESIEVPDTHSELVGVWRHDSLRPIEGEERGKYVLLQISAAGMLAYAWQETGEHASTCTVVGGSAITYIDAHRIDAGPFWSLTTELEIDRAPHQADGGWRMTVEGIELQRIADRVDRVGHGYACANGRLRQEEGAPDNPDESSDGGGTAI